MTEVATYWNYIPATVICVLFSNDLKQEDGGNML